MQILNTMVAQNVIEAKDVMPWEIIEPKPYPTPSSTYGSNIDKEIESYLLKLWDLGYTTIDSCAGHDTLIGAYVGFDGFYNKKLLKRDLEKVGLKVIRIEWLTTTYDRERKDTHAFFENLLYSGESLRRQLRITEDAIKRIRADVFLELGEEMENRC